MPTNRPRRHSLSSGDESSHIHPAKADGPPRLDSRGRARLPRSKSTSNVFEAFSRSPGTIDYDMRNIAFEQADVAALREVANFLRTTGPPPDRPATHDECLRLSGSSEPGRWSLRSLRRNKRVKLRSHSLQSHLPENVIPGTTAEGHRYIAISTPAPKNSNASGPWFRSQYPVFLPRPQWSPPPRPPSSPRAWPERNSSKTVSASYLEKGIIPGDTKHSRHPTARSIDKDPSPRAPVPEGARSRALSNRISTGFLLRAMLNSAEEGFRHDLGTSVKNLGSQRVPRMEQALQMQPLVAVHEEETEKPEAYKQITPPHISSSTKLSDVDIRRQSPSVSPLRGGSPRSPSKSPKRLANIVIQDSLAVPKKNLLPESPGFPNMLATMSFPSPPKGSRPSSPSSIAPSIADSQVSLSSCPVVQRRTSSRRANTSMSISAASLDEIVMRKRPSSRPMKSDRPWTAANSSTATIEAPSGYRPSTAPTELSHSLEHIVPDEADYGSTSPTGLTGSSCKELGVGSCGGGGGEESQRESLASQLTATTNYSGHSILTYSSSLSSFVSEMDIQSKATITALQQHSDTRQNPEHIHPPISERRANVEDMASKTTSTGKNEVGLINTDNLDFDRSYDDEAMSPALRPSITSDPDAETNPQSKGILERRLARKAKVHQYKIRDLDASRVDIVDSPILGYFTSNLPRGPNSAAEGSSASTDSVRRPSTLSMATIVNDASNEPLPEAGSRASIDSHHHIPSKEDRGRIEATVEVSPVSSVQLKISAIVATGIEPVYTTTPHWQTNRITMSPIMVVADVESRPGSPSLRYSTLTRPDSSSTRTVTRLKPIMMSAHSRQKSHAVTISRNPTTGAIERSASGTIDTKFNRRSLMTMPTPSLSPETIQSRKKRLSLPPVQLNLPVTRRDRRSLSQSREWHSSCNEEQEPDDQLRDDEEREPEDRLRNTASLKERVMREKLQKEKEITDIVAKTVGLPQKPTVYEDEQDSPPPEQNSTETLEKRLRRLERTNDAWLCAMKPLLETMARTLDDMRVDDRCRSLRMSDFVIDMEAEAKRGTHSRRGEKEKTNKTLQDSGKLASGGTKIRNAAGTTGTTPLSPILQELDDLPEWDKQEAPIMSATTTGEDGPGKNGAPSTTAGDIRGPSRTLQMQEQATAIQDDACKTKVRATGDAGLGRAGEVDESGDWPDLGPLIRELGVMPHNSQEKPEAPAVRETGGSNNNTLNPLMRDLRSASRLCAEQVKGTR
ncbi:hypothetical protein F4859DRAFT_509058 [Xylaria cf. heliscus]|nr:hypothetical protein F4859DRAFT_509058 [Xylaria cf. heliscus]